MFKIRRLNLTPNRLLKKRAMPLPVSVTAIVIRVIFKLKLADVIINVTSGGPGGATDSVTSFIFREYRDRSNVGYGTLLAMVYLVLIVIFVTLLLKLVLANSPPEWPRPVKSNRSPARPALSAGAACP